VADKTARRNINLQVLVSSNESMVANYIAANGCRLGVHVWKTQDPPLARVVFLHGISSHAGWYQRGNAYLAAAGIEVHFLDRRGSGINEVDRGDIDRWQTWVDDVANYLQRLQEQHGATVSLCGISWGGKLAAEVAHLHPKLLGGLGLICPGLYSSFEPGLAKRLALRMPVPQRVGRFLFAIPLRDPALFTDTPEWQKFIADDRLTLRKITWRFAREDRVLTRFARQAAPRLTMPLLLMLAGRDRIIDNRRVLDFCERSPSAHKTLIEYANAAHTLEFEPDPQPYFADLARWICGTDSGFRAG
jgi:alpha-beta hydrolase superfamily lysophospholipase